MTLKTLMMSAATAALIAGGAIAQQSDTESDAETDTEQTEAGSTDTGGETETDTGEMESEEAAPASDAMEETESEDASAEESTDDAMSEDSEMATSDAADMAAEDSMTMIPAGLEGMTVGEVVGLSVMSPDGDAIGEIDYLIEGADGLEMVIGIGGFLGLGEYTVALPLSEFEFDAEQGVLTLPMDQETLEQRPEIDESELEALPDDMMISQVVDGSGGSMEGASASGDDTMSTGDDTMSSGDDTMSSGDDTMSTGDDTMTESDSEESATEEESGSGN